MKKNFYILKLYSRPPENPNSSMCFQIEISKTLWEGMEVERLKNGCGPKDWHIGKDVLEIYTQDSPPSNPKEMNASTTKE